MTLQMKEIIICLGGGLPSFLSRDSSDFTPGWTVLANGEGEHK